LLSGVVQAQSWRSTGARTEVRTQVAKRQVTSAPRWNPYASNSTKFKLDRNFQHVSWDEAAAPRAQHAVAVERDPFERPDFQGTVQPAQLLAQSDDPFDLDIPEYDAPDENDPFNDNVPEPESVEDPAESVAEESFEDAFDDPDAEEEEEAEPETNESGSTGWESAPETLPPGKVPSETEEPEVDRILRDSKESLDEETMQGETSREAAELLKKYGRQSDEPKDNKADDEQSLFQDPDEDEKDDESDAEKTAKQLEEEHEEEAKRQKELAKARAESAKNCAEEFDKLRSARIENIDLSIRVKGEEGADYPFACGLGSDLHAPRSWEQITYMWKASGTCHKPLYFEQVQLERYGHSWGPYLQPIMSGAHFFGSVAALPYNMGIRTPNECVYTLGYYRPGSCAPYMIDPVPFTWRAVFFQGMAVSGAAVALP